MISRLLLCTDLDRTLIPNGEQPESADARPLFRELVDRPEVTLAYVTGRHRSLVRDAIEFYQLPTPDYVVANVGSTVYQLTGGGWEHWPEWEREIAVDWAGKGPEELKRILSDLQLLRLQERTKQSAFKLSYYVPMHADMALLEGQIQQRLQQEGITACLIWSVDEPSAIGLLDVLPARATKRHAIEFLMEKNGFDLATTLFAGDSGNDLPVLVSEIRSILVANASDGVKRAALEAVRQNGQEQALYLAQGGFLGMNGNYSAGILEGVVHFIPGTSAWINRRGVE